MPQLDFLIIFPQIFWFFLIFSVLYVYILHFFLPKLILILKLRKNFIKYNIDKTSHLNLVTINQKKLLNFNILVNIQNLNGGYFLNLTKLNDIFKIQKLSNPKLLNVKTLNSIFNYNIYCSKYILSSIQILPSNLNLNK